MKYKIMFPNTEALKGCPWMERVASAIDLGRNISNIPEGVEYCENKNGRLPSGNQPSDLYILENPEYPKISIPETFTLYLNEP
jgi:hypothetical protein